MSFVSIAGNKKYINVMSDGLAYIRMGQEKKTGKNLSITIIKDL